MNKLMKKEEIVSKGTAAPVGPFSTAVRAGDFIYISGQVGQDPATGRLVDGNIQRQTEQIFANLGEVIKAAGKTFDDVVRVGVFLTDMGSFAVVNSIYANYFSKPYPARTTVAVAALPLGAVIEIDVVVRD